MGQNGGFLIEEEKIRERVKELARRLSEDYRGKNPLFVGILKGAFIFLADLVREMDIDVEVDFLAVSSYGKSTESSGEVEIIKDLTVPVQGRDVVIVEDIVDTGLTLRYIYDLILSRKPRSLRICVLLDKKEKRRVDVPVDYVGFEVPPYFLVGYGLDCCEKYRNLKYIRALSQEEVMQLEEKGK
jgi:hypoxanthine phosphoribosyltransferase